MKSIVYAWIFKTKVALWKHPQTVSAPVKTDIPSIMWYTYIDWDAQFWLKCVIVFTDL